MLSDAGLSQDYLVEIIDIVCYVVKRSLTLDLVDKTPHEAWIGKMPSLSNLRVFGCD